jgi:uncharacterized protein DUF4386
MDLKAHCEAVSRCCWDSSPDTPTAPMGREPRPRARVNTFDAQVPAPGPSNEEGKMSTSRDPGRVAGLWYLLLIVIGPLRLIYIPGKLFVPGNAAATVRNIADHEWLFRLGIAGDLAGAVILVFFALALYRLFKGVDQNLAVLVVILGGVMPATIYFVSVVNDFAALAVVRGGGFLSGFDEGQRNGLAMLLLRLRDDQNTAAEILWGMWLLPLAALVYRSRFLPRFLGVWLAVNGVAYIVLSLTGVLAPQYQDQVFTLSRPARLGELVLMLWLVIKGATPPAIATGSPAEPPWRAP